MKNYFYLFIIIVNISCDNLSNISDECNNLTKHEDCKTDLCSFFLDNGCYVHEINGFYIVSSSELPTTENGFNPSALELFNHSIKLFSSFLDQDNDGHIDDIYLNLNDGLSKNLAFVIGHRDFVDEITSKTEKYGVYGMGMFSDKWPYIPTYNGKSFEINELKSSLWRPDNQDATWEETFHTITEAFNRIDDDFKFTKGAYLRELMDQDISNGTYDISEQNDLENGEYDSETAVNEYIHQIWQINFSGQADKLNIYQKKALEFMIMRGVPMVVNPNYKFLIGERIK
jgi:hypothetical protein